MSSQQQQVIQQNQRQVSVSYNQINQLLGGIEPAWYGLDMQGWYLPRLKAGCITCSYLYQVATNKVFRIKKSDIRQGSLLKSIQKKELFLYLAETIGNQNQNLGFDKQLPNKDWLINVLFTLTNGQHDAFKKPFQEDQVIKIPQQDFEQLRQLDTSLYRPKTLRFFRRTKEEIQNVKTTKRNTRFKRLEKQIKMKERDLQISKGQKREYELKTIAINLKIQSSSQQDTILKESQKKLLKQQ